MSKHTQRGYLKEYLGNNRAVFVCRNGHETRMAVIKRRGLTDKYILGHMSSGIAQMVSWWSKEKGGCTFECPKCTEGRDE